MIGHDDVDAQSGRVLHHLVRANAGIDADDQLHAQRRGVLHRFALHAIAVANAMRDETSGDRARQIEHFLQHHQRAGSIDVVIAIEQNRFFAFDGLQPVCAAAACMSASKKGSCRSAAEGARNRRAAAGSLKPRAHNTRAAGREMPRAADSAAALAGSTSAMIHFIRVLYCYIRGCNLRVAPGHQNSVHEDVGGNRCISVLRYRRRWRRRARSNPRASRCLARRCVLLRASASLAL